MRLGGRASTQWACGTDYNLPHGRDPAPFTAFAKHGRRVVGRAPANGPLVGGNFARGGAAEPLGARGGVGSGRRPNTSWAPTKALADGIRTLRATRTFPGSSFGAIFGYKTAQHLGLVTGGGGQGAMAKRGKGCGSGAGHEGGRKEGPHPLRHWSLFAEPLFTLVA